MTILRSLSLCVLLLLVAACSAGEAALPTRVVISDLATSLPTHTPISQTATPPATNTPTLPPTDTATPEPSPTATALPTATPFVPFTQGTLYFIWHPEPKPAPEDMGQDEVPAKNLYAAIPGQTPGEWEIRLVLPNIRCFCQPKLSPEKSQMAFVQTEDSNQDGYFYTSEDRQTLYTYSFIEQHLTRLDHFDFSEQFSWLSNNETLLYRYRYNINWGLAKTDGSPSVPLGGDLQATPEAPLNIRHLDNSPNGLLQTVAIWTSSSRIQLALFDITQKAITPILDANGIDILVTWSPDNQWLAATLIAGTQELYVINMETLIATQIVTTENSEKRVYPPAWSSKGDWLAFVEDNTTLWSWHQSTATVTQLASKNFVGSPIWSPQEDVVAVSFTTDVAGGILLANPAEKSVAELTLDGVPLGPPIWTPDGQWLLFPAKQNETTGYYMIYRQGGEVYLVFDTTGLYEPSDFFWLSN